MLKWIFKVSPLVSLLVFSLVLFFTSCSTKQHYILKLASNQGIAHTQRITALAYSYTGDCLVSGGYDSNVILWDGRSGEFIRTITGEYDKIFSMILLKDNKTLITGNYAGYVIIWNIQKKENPVKKIRAHKEFIGAMALSPDGEKFITASWDGVVKIWDTKNIENPIECVSTGEKIYDARYIDNKHIVLAFDSGSLGSFNTENCKGNPKSKLSKKRSVHKESIFSIAVNRKKKTVMSVSSDKTIKISLYPKFKTIRTINLHQGSVNDVDYNAKKNTFASVSDDSYAMLWDFENMNLMVKVAAHSAKISSVKIHPSGLYMATAGFDGEVKVWQLKKFDF